MNKDTGREAKGYILEGTDTKWTLKINNNSVIRTHPHIYGGGLIFLDQVMINNIPYNVLSYSPICLLISINANELTYTTYRLVYHVGTQNRTILIHTLCTWRKEK